MLGAAKLCRCAGEERGWEKKRGSFLRLEPRMRSAWEQGFSLVQIPGGLGTQAPSKALSSIFPLYDLFL